MLQKSKEKGWLSTMYLYKRCGTCFKFSQNIGACTCSILWEWPAGIRRWPKTHLKLCQELKDTLKTIFKFVFHVNDCLIGELDLIGKIFARFASDVSGRSKWPAKRRYMIRIRVGTEMIHNYIWISKVICFVKGYSGWRLKTSLYIEVRSFCCSLVKSSIVIPPFYLG
mgnify:CR=1 FL=1